MNDNGADMPGHCAIQQRKITMLCLYVVLWIDYILRKYDNVVEFLWRFLHRFSSSARISENSQMYARTFKNSRVKLCISLFVWSNLWNYKTYFKNSFNQRKLHFLFFLYIYLLVLTFNKLIVHSIHIFTLFSRRGNQRQYTATSHTSGTLLNLHPHPSTF